MVTRGRRPDVRQRPTRLIAAVTARPESSLAARRLIDLAAEAGANAIVFPMTPRWPLSTWRTILKHAAGRLDVCLAPGSADDVTAQLRPAAWQVNPDVLGDEPLLKAVAGTRRPVIVVAGACTDATLKRTLKRLRGRAVTLLHTVASRGLAPGQARLGYIKALGRFRVPVGYLGAEAGVGWSLVAAALGAVAIEKAFVADRPAGTIDASLDPAQLHALATALDDLASALEPVGARRVFADEMPDLEQAGRSLAAKRGLRRGHVLLADDLESVASAGGLSPRLRNWLVGRRLLYDLQRGEPITFGVVETA